MAHTVYKVNGKKVKSVTTLIGANLGWSKFALLAWTRKHCLKGDDSMAIMKEAGRIGTLAHIMIEQFIKGGSVILDGYSPKEISHAKEAYYNFLNFKEDYNPEILETELKMVSEKYKFGGTCDAVANVKIGKNTKLMMLDWKSSNSLHEEHKIQIAAYAKMYEEVTGKRIQGAMIVRVDKEKKEYEVSTLKIKDLNYYWRIFKLILKLQELKK